MFWHTTFSRLLCLLVRFMLAMLKICQKMTVRPKLRAEFKSCSVLTSHSAFCTSSTESTVCSFSYIMPKNISSSNLENTELIWQSQELVYLLGGPFVQWEITSGCKIFVCTHETDKTTTCTFFHELFPAA